MGAPLLAELHAHTTWSDGVLTPAELVDLYGGEGFDVLCITDHALRSKPLGTAESLPRSVHIDNYPTYLEEIERQAERASAQYGLLLLPGLELTDNDPDPDLAAHALAIGVRQYVPVDDGIEAALVAAGEAGAALVAAHPHDTEGSSNPGRLTRRFARERERLGPLVHRYELFNRLQLFRWVSDANLPHIATGDFHRVEHLAGWKTYLPCERSEAAVVAHLRSAAPVYLARRDAQGQPLAA